MCSLPGFAFPHVVRSLGTGPAGWAVVSREWRAREGDEDVWAAALGHLCVRLRDVAAAQILAKKVPASLRELSLTLKSGGMDLDVVRTEISNQ